MSTVKVQGVTVDLEDVTSDGERWRGRVRFAYKFRTAVATWLGADGSDMGALHDIEGDEVTCDVIDAFAGEIESAITDALGDPHEDDGRSSMFAAIEQERAVREAMMGV